MVNIPKIIVKKDLESEKMLFMVFLNHNAFPQNRNKIFNAFPKLEEYIKETENEEESVDRFLGEFYKENKNRIESMISESKKRLEEESKEALGDLGELMDYKWKEGVEYMAIPTILPFSPFDKETFYFSILGGIWNKKQKDVLQIAVHEISHFIFFEYYRNIEILKNISPHLIHYFKESLTTALLNKDPLKKTLKIDKDLGNPEIQELYIEEKGGAKKIVDYVKDEYKKPFEGFLLNILEKFSKKDKDFIEKRMMWNKYGRNILNDKKLLSKYKEPIRL